VFFSNPIKLLRKAGLTKKELANILKINVGSVNNWGSTQNIPYWVKSWLENYIEKKKLESIKQSLINSGICDEILK